MHIIAQTPDFVIRNFTAEEEDAYMALFDDEQVTQHLPYRTRQEHIKIFKQVLDDYAENKALGRWGIFNNVDDDFMGFCLLRNYEDEEGKVELGYAMHKKYWGKGLASEMATIMVGYALTHTDAKEIVGITTLGNIGSQKVLEKAGLVRENNFMKEGKELAYFRLKR
ncbi:GNAT family N-acetyltransferase [Mucilaginibacter sp. McL0603]|uniref:GNAT family N-acetyltransferase n=1 Tax=Mucilaginibacter sp. McL0603 TaxID=3415670 RepID=UPI003CEB1F68